MPCVRASKQEAGYAGLRGSRRIRDHPRLAGEAGWLLQLERTIEF